MALTAVRFRSKPRNPATEVKGDLSSNRRAGIPLATR